MYFQESPLAIGETETIYQVMCPNIKFKEINWLNYFHQLRLLEYKSWVRETILRFWKLNHNLDLTEHLEMTTHFSVLAWGVPWTEEPGMLQSMGSQELDMT